MNPRLNDLARADGVAVTLTTAGSLRIVGDAAAVAKWTPIIRQSKVEVVADLRGVEVRFNAWVRGRLPAGNRVLADAWARIERGEPARLTVGERCALRAWVSELVDMLGEYSNIDWDEACRFSTVLLASEDAWGINKDDIQEG